MYTTGLYYIVCVVYRETLTELEAHLCTQLVCILLFVLFTERP